MARLLMTLLIFAPFYLFFWWIRKLFSGKPQEAERTVIQTRKTLPQVAGTLQKIAGELMAQVDEIGEDPLSQFSGASLPELAVVLHGRVNSSSDSWAVQIYAEEAGGGCKVELVALGENLASGYRSGFYVGRLAMKYSKKYKDRIAGSL